MLVLVEIDLYQLTGFDYMVGITDAARGAGYAHSFVAPDFISTIFGNVCNSIYLYIFVLLWFTSSDSVDFFNVLYFITTNENASPCVKVAKKTYSIS